MREVFLYEFYEDEAAFQTHLASDHFKSFDSRAARMVERKDVRIFSKVISC